MNFQNVENEIKKYTDFFKCSQSTLAKFSNYYKEIGKTGNKFADKMKKLLDEFYADLIREDRSTTYNKMLTNFYNEKTRFISKIKSYFLLIEKNYGERLSDFEKDYRNKNKEILSKLNKMNSTFTDSKNIVDKWKNQYFDMCKSIVEVGKKINNLEKNDTPEKERAPETIEMLNKLKAQLTKNKEMKEVKKNNYKNEEIKLNKLLESNESVYKTIIESIEKEYTNKINFVHQILKEINTSSSNFINEFTESVNKVELIRADINTKRDARQFRQDFNFYSTKFSKVKEEKRFILEEFLDYDYSITNSENPNKKISGNNLNIKQNNDDGEDVEYNRAKLMLNLGEKKFVDFENLNQKGKEINDIIINLLTKENKIEDKEFFEIINYIENNGENCSNFMELLVTHFCQKEFVIINNLGNFHNLINILIIILNYCFNKKEIIDICFLVMYVAEKGIYYSKEENEDINAKLLMFKIISKQTIFNSINFWRDLINKRLDIVALIDVRKEFEKRRKNVINNSIGVFGKLFGKKEDNKIIENEILQSNILKEKSSQYFTIVFYDFLKHFANFNFLKGEELLNSFKEKYNLDETTIKFFKNILKSNNIYKKEKEINIKDKKNKKEKSLFNFKSNKHFRNITDKSLISVLFSFKYLDKSDYLSILCTNKEYNQAILGIMYKHILLKNIQNIDIKKHLEIWKILLNYKVIKKEYDYNKIKESNKNPNKKIINSDIIDLDIKRTFFSNNKEEKMEKIRNILRAISSELPELNYYQGMNQISAFLLNICDNNEEEAFYLYMSFLKSTQYITLYKNDLEKINVLFYLFDRLLNLYLPEIYTYFKASSINSGYFVSPWLITLFTNAFNDIENSNNAKSIMIIWDLFIFTGWKSIVKIGIILLKKKERYIMKNFPECLLPLLTGDILKSEILDKQHFEELVDLCKNEEFRIPTELFERIMEEYEIKKTVPYFSQQSIQESHLNTY